MRGIFGWDCNERGIACVYKAADNFSGKGDYLNSVMRTGDKEGVPLTNYQIIKVDTTDPGDIKVRANLTFEGLPPLPDIDYHVVKKDGEYQLLKQSCVYDIIPGSPDYRTVECSQPVKADPDPVSISKR